MNSEERLNEVKNFAQKSVELFHCYQHNKSTENYSNLLQLYSSSLQKFNEDKEYKQHLSILISKEGFLTEVLFPLLEDHFFTHIFPSISPSSSTSISETHLNDFLIILKVLKRISLLFLEENLSSEFQQNLLGFETNKNWIYFLFDILSLIFLHFTSKSTLDFILSNYSNNQEKILTPITKDFTNYPLISLQIMKLIISALYKSTRVRDFAFSMINDRNSSQSTSRYSSLFDRYQPIYCDDSNPLLILQSVLFSISLLPYNNNNKNNNNNNNNNNDNNNNDNNKSGNSPDLKRRKLIEEEEDKEEKDEYKRCLRKIVERGIIVFGNISFQLPTDKNTTIIFPLSPGHDEDDNDNEGDNDDDKGDENEREGEGEGEEEEEDEVEGDLEYDVVVKQNDIIVGDKGDKNEKDDEKEEEEGEGEEEELVEMNEEDIIDLDEFSMKGKDRDFIRLKNKFLIWIIVNQIMEKYKENEEIITSSIRTISNMIIKDKAKEEGVKCGLVNKIMDLIERFSESEGINEHGHFTLGTLAQELPHIQQILLSRGYIDNLIHSFKKFYYQLNNGNEEIKDEELEVGEDASYVLNNIVIAFGHIASANNKQAKKEIEEKGALKLIVKFFKKFQNAEEFVRSCLVAVYYTSNNKNRRFYGENGVPSLIANAIRSFISNPQICSLSISAILMLLCDTDHLSKNKIDNNNINNNNNNNNDNYNNNINNDNSDKKDIDIKGNDNDNKDKNNVKEEEEENESQLEFVKSGGIESVKLVVEHYFIDPKLLGDCFNCFGQIGWRVIEFKDLMVQANVIQLILKYSEYYLNKSKDVIKEAIFALNVVVNSSLGSFVFKKVKGNQFMKKVSSIYPDDPNFVIRLK